MQDRLRALWRDRCAIMGVVNVTPDSFSGDGVLGGQIRESVKDPVGLAVDQATRFLADGVAILDIGGESTRPGADPVDLETELARVVPAIQAIRRAAPDAVISVDTYKAQVAAAALDAGATLINDVWAGRADPNMIPLAAARRAPIVLMHNRAQWGAVEKDPKLGAAYRAPPASTGGSGPAGLSFMDQVLAETEALVAQAKAAGIDRSDIIVDPGIGFGKTVAQNLALIREVARFKQIAPTVLLGASRKNFIGKVLDKPVSERLMGTAATAAIGAYGGADILRVHDGAEMVQMAVMAQAIRDADPDAERES